MHPSPDALTRMPDAELRAYALELRRLSADADETFNGPYRTRAELCEAILQERRYPLAD